jgi:hypothetical protein
MDRPPSKRRPGSHARLTRRPRLLAAATGLILVLALLIGLLAARDVAGAGAAAEQAVATSRQTVQQAIDGDTSGARQSLSSVLADLDRAGSSLDTVWISLVGLFPPIAAEVDAATAGIEAARSLALAGNDLLEFATADRPPLLHDGRLDVGALGLLDEALVRARTNAAAARTALKDVPGSRVAAVRDNLEQLEEASTALDQGLMGAAALVARLERAVTGGEPFRVLILFENGAELRATGGLIGFVAELAIDRSPLRLTNIGPTTGLHTTDATGSLASVAAPADYLARYDVYLANTTLWSNVNLSPHFPTVARVAGALYQQATGNLPELVVRLDLTGAGRILSAIPPEARRGFAFAPSQLATDFVVDSYLRFPDADDQNAYLAQVVGGMFARMLAAPTVDGAMLGRALVGTARERHLALFSADPAIQGALTTAGADGSLQPGDPGQVEVVVQNFGANKLDLFTQTHFDVTLDPSACTMTGSVSTTITNAAPPQAAQLPSRQQTADGIWWVNTYLPAGATVLDILEDGEVTGGSVQTEGGRPVAAALIDIPAGQSVTVTVRWQEELTGPTYHLALQPQPLVNPATVAVSGFPPQSFTRTAPFEVPTQCPA